MTLGEKVIAEICKQGMFRVERHDGKPQEAPYIFVWGSGSAEQIEAVIAETSDEARTRRLRAALDAATDVGLYPHSVVGGDKPYEKRTEYMEGWNDSRMATLRAVVAVLESGDWDGANE